MIGEGRKGLKESMVIWKDEYIYIGNESTLNDGILKKKKEVAEIEEDDEEIESEIEQEEENEENGVVEIDDKAEEDEADGDGDENKEDAIQVLKNNCQKHRWRNRCREPPTTF